MWVIVGLGNPGKKYFLTRHNVGYRVIDLLSKKVNTKLTKRRDYEFGVGSFENREFILMKPLTYMNRSGKALKELSETIAGESMQLVVVHDDIDLPIGSLRIKRKGSSGGHKGVESIIEELNTGDFIRVKVGIGRNSDVPVEEYVLENFTPSEEGIIKDSINTATEAILKIITSGVNVAMNEFNRQKNKQERLQSLNSQSFEEEHYESKG